ncbi:type II toxin-antitoxin system PemK/MazF family toxin [Geobacillus jurassicus]|uniref:Type II toxin-antitoxin system PemK/MazF family toxin n=1 Tax=Geobacillus jurassicus TaxID=235932 RepID=A0ABV6GWX6_9BACL|nr:type II toxin-antitoxin system PemK/MazF family toxin [Geobacillus jurassicus]
MVFVGELGEHIGTEQNGARLVLILSNDRMNRTSGSVKAGPH